MNTGTAESSRAIVAWFRDTTRWDVAFFRRLEWRWPEDVIRPVGHAVFRRRVEVDADADRASLPIIEKISFGGEISVTAPNDRIGYKGRLFWANAGNLIYSKIRAKQGSLAIVPEELGNLAVSAEYPVYEINTKVADPCYLALVLRSTPFKRLLEGLSHGGSTKTRTPPEEFERQLIPLPPLPVQRNIVTAWGAVQKSVAVTAARVEQLEHAIELRFLADLGLEVPKMHAAPKALVVHFSEIERWGVDYNQRLIGRLDPGAGKYPVAILGNVIADLENGWSPKCFDRPAAVGEWGVLKMGAVSFGFFDELQNKAIPPRLSKRADLEVRPGDFLISRANVTRLVGACALVRRTRPGLMLCDKIFRAVWQEPSPVDPRYLDEILKIPHVRQQIEGAVTGTSATMKNITKPSLLALKIPMPPLSVQGEMMERLDAGRAEIAKLKAQAKAQTDAAKAGVDAMILGTQSA